MATSTSSGWNKPSGAAKPVQKKPSAARGIVAGLVVVILALAGAWYFLGDSLTSTAPKEKKTKTIKEVKPVKGGTGTNGISRVREVLNEQVKEFVKKKTPTNGISWSMPDLAPDDPDRILYTRLSNELSAILSVEPGDPIPPLPFAFLQEEMQRKAAEAGEDVGEIDNGNSSFLESLKKWKLTAKSTDDETRLNVKQRLLEAHDELLAAMNEGVSVNDSVRAAYEFRVNAHEMRSTIVQTLADLHAKDGNEADTIAQIEDMNKRLANDGIKKISISEVIPEYETEEEEE